jgi:hypothetical protein
MRACVPNEIQIHPNLSHLRQGALSAASPPNNANFLPGQDVEADVVKDIR